MYFNFQWMHVSLAFAIVCALMLSHSAVYSSSLVDKLSASYPKSYVVFGFVVISDVMAFIVSATLQIIFRQVKELSPEETVASDVVVFGKGHGASKQSAGKFYAVPNGDDDDDDDYAHDDDDGLIAGKYISRTITKQCVLEFIVL
jgi:hypothetical protein